MKKDWTGVNQTPCMISIEKIATAVPHYYVVRRARKKGFFHHESFCGGLYGNTGVEEQIHGILAGCT
jgi:hypothetical protein